MIPYGREDQAKIWDGEAQCKGKIENINFRFTLDSLGIWNILDWASMIAEIIIFS